MRLSEFVSFILTLSVFMVVTIVGMRIVDSYLTLCEEVHAIAERVEQIENSDLMAGIVGVNQER